MLCSLGFKTRAAGTDGSTGLRYPTTKSWPVKSVISGKVRNSANVFLKKWPKPGLFLFIFVLFTFQFKWPIYNLNKINSKKHRWCAWDLNPGQQDGRRRQIHWAMAAPPPPLLKFVWCNFFEATVLLKLEKVTVLQLNFYSSTVLLNFYAANESWQHWARSTLGTLFL